jgi:hypothetical protein
MSPREEQLKRLRVAMVTGRLPHDLAAWILEQLQPPAGRRAHRVQELRRAAAAIGGSRKTIARELAQIVQTFDELPGLVAVAWYPEGTPERIVQQLMRAGVVPRSTRQFLRLIA